RGHRRNCIGTKRHGRRTESKEIRSLEVRRRRLPGRLPGSQDSSAAPCPLIPRALGGEVTSRWEVCLIFRHCLEKMEVATSDLVQEFPQERLMVGLAQRLVALPEAAAFVHFEAVASSDQL